MRGVKPIDKQNNMTPENWARRITSLNSDTDFEALALEAFRFQYEHIGVYKYYVDLLGIPPQTVDGLSKIPFLPISAFKNHRVIYKGAYGSTVFTSSGTTGSINSQHVVADTALYQASFLAAFNLFYGQPSNYVILALLPSYLERADSSLIFMVRGLMEQSRHPQSGFYLYNYADLHTTLSRLKLQGKTILLIGVTFALLEFAEKYPILLPDAIIMETGGMKGRRKELTRTELHQNLTSAFGCPHIHSEYGMTELLSQAYSKGDGVFESPPWMQIMIRDPYDPLSLLGNHRTGGINVIDLANINSCCFIETQDLGRKISTQKFEVLGRFDNSDIRGCNLMAQ